MLLKVHQILAKMKCTHLALKTTIEQFGQPQVSWNHNVVERCFAERCSPTDIVIARDLHETFFLKTETRRIKTSFLFMPTS
jgi:hypothetical protein